MKIFGKKTISVMAALLAVLFLMPTEAAAAATSTAKNSNDSGIYWTSTLPTGGDFSYKTDTGWYHLVLEWGDYTSNLADSDGKYVQNPYDNFWPQIPRVNCNDWDQDDYEDLVEETLIANLSIDRLGTSWPTMPFNRYWGTQVGLENMYDTKGVSEAWNGIVQHTPAAGGTKKRDADSDLYSSGEYSEDGLMSLYIKCAGQDSSGKYCYYISPCDNNGDRSNRIWALDCCLDTCYDDFGDCDEYEDMYYSLYGYRPSSYQADQWNTYFVQGSPWAKNIGEGINPTFTLVEATPDQLEKDFNLTHAGITTPCMDYLYVARGGQLIHLGDNSANNGMIVGKYKNNYKWYIEQKNGVWTIRSAGSIEWDWTDTKGTFVKIFDDPATALENALSVYAKVIAYESLSGLKSRSDSGKEYDILKNYYIDPWCSHEGNNLTAEWVVPMLFLTDYAQNVYITGGYQNTVTWLDDGSGGNMTWTGNVRETPDIIHPSYTARQLELYDDYGVDYESAVIDGKTQFFCSYCMTIVNKGITAKQLDKWIDAEIADAEDQGDAIVGHYYTSDKAESPKDETKIKVYGTTSDADGSSEDDYDYYTVEEIKSKLPFTIYSFYTPSAETGDFTALYVGVPLNTEHYDEGNADLVIEKGVTKVLGATDKNGDGVCDGAAYIGTLAKHAQLRRNGYVRGVHITVEKGASLYIDGPTFATLGTTIEVKGTMYINPGAFLTPEDVRGTSLKDTWYHWMKLNINGGTVIVSNGAMLNIGDSNLEISNGGSLINNGIFIQGTDSKVKTGGKIAVTAGSIENYSGAWFISGANVLKDQRLALMKGITGKKDLTTLSKYISDVYDDDLKNYPDNAFEDGKGDTYVQLRMYGNMEVALFRNNGSAFISGAIKGSDANRNFFMGNGALYRAKDIYSGSLTVSGTSLTAHSGKDVNSDAGIKKFYELYGIKYSGTNTIEEEKGETEAIKKNILALRVGTGSQGTEMISSFKLVYQDTSGNERVEYVNPGGLESTYNFVKNWQYCGDDQNQRGDSLLRSFENGANLSGSSFPTGIEAMSDEVYLFQTAFPADYIKSISILGTGSGSWICTGLEVYRVRILYPLEEYGLFSEDWYVPFKGTLMADVTLNPDSSGVDNLMLSWDSEEISFGTGLYQLNVYDTPITVSSKKDGAGFVYYNVSSEKISYCTQKQSYTFSVSLADADSAGIETLYNVSQAATLNNLLNDSTWMGALSDDIKLDMELVYIDTLGSVRTVTIPLLQSTLTWVNDNLDENSKNAPIHGLFQQGETLAFEGALPDFAELVETHLFYEDKKTTDAVSVTSITLSQPTHMDTYVSDGVLKIEFPDSALYFYSALDTKGVYCTNGQSMNVPMKEWNGVESLRPQPQSSQYLVVVETDKMSTAATAEELYVSFAYKTVSGVNATTGSYSLRSAVNDYFGYWRDVNGSDVDCAYRIAVSPGGEMYFVIEVPNLYEFTSATFSMDGTAAADVGENDGTALEEYNSTGSDEWQMSAITIYELSSLGERKVNLGEQISTMGIVTNRTYYRDNNYGSRGVLNRGKGPLMVSPGSSKTISFEEGGTITGGGESHSKNNATNVVKLSWEDTKQDFGFRTKRAKYTVSVQVDGSSITSVEDGDCGSKNQFYFQLIFQDDNGELHSSPCVLSNQQLQSDGFRTGTEEEFCIYTNDDYGTPVQINIIPDDTSSSSDVFDKLCIDHITVSRTSGTGVNMSWRVDDVGWIDIEYKEDAEEQQGRAADVLIRSFPLIESGYKVWIEFAIETSAEYIDGKQYIGQMLADITYRDPSGAIRTKQNVAVVGRIADYAERMSEVESVTDGTENSIPTYMFKNGYTNRFLVEFEDISSLVNIKLKATPQNDSSISVKKVSARQVYDQGNLSLNIFNEYERSYSIEPQNLAATSNLKPLKIEPNGGTATGVLAFSSGNSIKIYETEGSEELEIQEGDSEGINDVIAVAAELSDVTGIDAGAALPVKITYKDIYGDAYSVNAELVFDAESGQFMVPVTDLPQTPNFGVPYEVEVTAQGGLSGRGLEAVTITQLRDSQTVERFSLVPPGGTKLDASVPTTITLSESEQDEYAKSHGYTDQAQVVYLELGGQTEKKLLTESQDLEVALRYTEKNDPYGLELLSDSVSLMDCGYITVQSGMIVKLPMNVKNVGDVKALVLTANSDKLKLSAVKGCISIEEKSNITDTVVSRGWVNLPTATGTISADTATEMSTDGKTITDALTSATRVTPVSINAQFTSIDRSDAIVKISVHYGNNQNVYNTLAVEKTAKEWNSGEAWFLAEGFSEIQYYFVEVYDKDAKNIAGVTLDSLSFGWYSSTEEFTTTSLGGNLTITEGTPLKKLLLDTELKGTVTVTGGSQVARLEDNRVTAGRTDYSRISVDGGAISDVYFSFSIDGLPNDAEVICIDTSTGEEAFIHGKNQNAAVQSLRLYPYYGTAVKTYEITVRSKTFPELFESKVYIDVQPVQCFEFVMTDANGSIMESGTFTSSKSITEYVKSDFTNVVLYARVSDPGTQSYQKMSYQRTMPMGPTVSVEENAALAGYEGTWTKFTITNNGSSAYSVVRFTVYGSLNPNMYLEFGFRELS